jgi:uncharacterized protein (TIGR02246 family)
MQEVSMKLMRLVPAVSAAVLALGLAPASAQSKDPAVEKLAADWAAAFTRADAKALASLYTDNAIRVTPESGRIVGRDAIGKEFATNFAGPWKGAAIKITTGDLQVVAPDIAVGEGTYEVTGVKGPDGKPVPPIKGTYVNTLVKKNGAWLLASNAAVLPAAPPR